jgi:DNA-binding MarR family transcriptional regulator/N-acetylglutamate synthase-like GNAT family acetyltransferase
VLTSSIQQRILAQQEDDPMDAIDRLRQFNRFYTRRIGLLEEGLSQSPFSLTQARVLYELAHRNSPTAAEIARDLGLDPAQLSRILQLFRAQDLVTRAPSETHAKHQLLTLTPAGRDAFEALEQAAVAEVADLLAPLGAGSRRRLVEAAAAIEDALSAPANTVDPGFTLRGPRVGDIGWVIHRQGALYGEEYGWDWTFEALAARILGDFVKRFDACREQVWIAERHGAIVGSVFLMRGDDETTAKLRLLYVEPHARGAGIGAALVEACIARAREVNYRRLVLWTNDILISARRLYLAAGFKLIDEQAHVSFGKALIGQTWALELQ